MLKHGVEYENQLNVASDPHDAGVDIDYHLDSNELLVVIENICLWLFEVVADASNDQGDDQIFIFLRKMLPNISLIL